MDNNIRYDELTGSVFGSDGEKIGGIGTLYTDDNTGRPSWVTVKTGLFGARETFVPLDSASIEGNDIRVPYTKDQVKDAPNVDADEHLDVEQERQLYSHYERNYDDYGTYGDRERDEHFVDGDRDRDVVVDRDRDLDVNRDRTLDRDVEGDSVTLREERLNVGKEQREVGQARLRKYTVTEHQTVEVPVTREEVRVVREPVNETDVDGRIGDDDRDVAVTLHEERPVISKETVATERVGLEKTAVQGTERVEADIQKERVETEGLETRAGFEGDRDIHGDKKGGLKDRLDADNDGRLDKDDLDRDQDGKIGR